MDSEDETLQQIADRKRERERKADYRRRQSELQKRASREIDRLHKEKRKNETQTHTSILKFEKKLMNIKINYCPLCSERYPDIELKDNTCHKCRMDKGHPKKFSPQNGMHPGIQPRELKNLTPIEELLIAKCTPIIKVYKLKGGQISYGGHIITFAQDVQQFINSLPRHPSQIGVLIVRRGFKDGHFDFKVRRERILQALLWLKLNNIYYKDITINMETIDLLPNDGDISHMIPSVTTENEMNGEILNEDYFESHVAKTVYASEQTMLEESLRELILDEDAPLPWPRMEDSPIHEFTTIGYIAQCFPTLYPNGNSDFLEPRMRKIYPQEYFRHLFRFDDGRFARHNTWRYFALNSIMRWSALTDGSVYYNRARHSIPPTISELKRSLDGGQLKRIAETMLYFGRNLRGSKQFWFQRQRELLAMVRCLGCPTYFFTFSAADFHWKPLHKLLHDKNLDDVTISERRKAIIEHPGITSWFIEKKMSLFLKDVVSKVMPFRDYWYRFEWQHRGSGHVHGFLWLESAPNVDELNFCDPDVQQLICDFHNNYTSTMNPEPGLLPGLSHPCQMLYQDATDLNEDYAELVNRVQLHTKCSKDYCIRINKKTKQPTCRFGFPKDLSENTVIDMKDGNPVISTVRNDPLVNSHNKMLLQAWRANMDIKPVICSDFVVKYVSKYCTKSEVRSNNLQEIMLNLSANLDQDSSPKELAQKLLIHSVGERDFSAQETCHLLQSLPLYHSSRTYVMINTFYDCESYKVKKRQLGITDGILEVSNLINVYKYRPNTAELNAVSLIEFAQKYIKVKEEIRRRKLGKEAVAVVLPYIQKNEKDPNYCRQFLYLNKPFRDEEMMEHDMETYVEMFDDFILNNPGKTPASAHREDVSDEDDDWELDEEEQHNQAQWMTLAGLQPDSNIYEGVDLGLRPVDNLCDWDEIREKYPDWQNMSAFIKHQKEIDQEKSKVDIQLFAFSPEQKRAFELVTNHYKALMRTEGLCEQLRLIVQGVAGTGKSYLIDRLRQFLNQDTNTTKGNVLEVVAYTGVAAFNVRGETIHSYFQLPINAASFKELSGISERRLQEKLKEVKYVIVDEMSMIGCRTLGMINQRLKQGFPTTQHLPFGGLNMILMGDHAQLPPLFDLPLYSIPASNSNPLVIDGSSIYKAFDKAIILSQCYRQAGTSSDEVTYREILMRLRNGINTEEDWKFLLNRSRHNLSQKDISVFDESIRLFTTNEECNKYNRQRLLALKQPIVKIESVNVGKEASKADRDAAGGLERSLYLCKNSSVMLTSNLWKSKGLVNGSLGVVHDIVFAPNTSPGELPLFILVEFKLYTGCGCLTGTKIVPIPVLKHTWVDCSGGSNSRSQIPLVLGFGITIHKSQGLTLASLVLDIGNTEFATGLAYVGMSRVKGYKDLMFNSSFDFERLKAVRKSRRFNERILEEARLQRLASN